MRRLMATWVALYLTGAVLIFLDLAAQVLISINGVPAVGLLGGAMILMALSSALSWLFKEAWEERTRANLDTQNDEPAQ